MCEITQTILDNRLQRGRSKRSDDLSCNYSSNVGGYFVSPAGKAGGDKQPIAAFDFTNYRASARGVAVDATDTSCRDGLLEAMRDIPTAFKSVIDLFRTERRL
ncbi:hypothetical protein ASG03_03450 [Rhizobium sp. Leaf341]|nr:hypothetical protein ASG03_03450 [Rhizobium sp. Leaf341]